MRKPELPGWLKVTMWGTLILFLAAIFVPLSLRLMADGLRGDFDPDVIKAREHKEEVELESAKSKERITSLESRVRSLDKILSGTGSKDIPTEGLLAELPACRFEDGTGQDVCVWDGRNQGNKVGAIVLNINGGMFAFFPQTNGWVVN